jgi:exosortase
VFCDLNRPFVNMLNDELIDPATASPQGTSVHSEAPAAITESPSLRARSIRFGVAVLVLGLCFARPLFDLVKYAVHSDLYSHVLLVPFVSLYLVWVKRHVMTLSKQNRLLALLPFIAGLAILIGYCYARILGGPPSPENYLVCMTLAFLVFLSSGFLWFAGVEALRAIAFPALFLLFAVPFPESVLHRLECFLQVGSAAAAHLLFQISGTPVLQHGMVFQLPGFSLEVARQCSGIHSSLVLLMTAWSLPISCCATCGASPSSCCASSHWQSSVTA